MDAAALGQIGDFLTGIATTLGVIGAGVWFFFRRNVYPRATVEPVVSEVPMPDGWTLLRVSVRIKNIGERLLKLVSCRIAVQHVLPVDSKIRDGLATGAIVVSDEPEAPWRVLCDRTQQFPPNYEIEPGETHEVDRDIFLRNRPEVVLIYIYIENRAKRFKKIGWRTTVIITLPPSEHAAQGVMAPTAAVLPIKKEISNGYSTGQPSAR